MRTIKAYKLFALHKDGSIGPLFINRKLRVVQGVWMEAECIPTPGFAVRFGWHACAEPTAPHLSKKGRVWCEVRLRGIKKHYRPAAQGGLWYTAKHLKVVRIFI